MFLCGGNTGRAGEIPDTSDQLPDRMPYMQRHERQRSAWRVDQARSKNLR
ncbi:hypothetical protein ASZ90_015449 [hydrocarbon metagenome]|uniref:Uncharacterized protein n=1 Tax=hydrocarbon metagenome TaxID=938273 RepID=A0A0W8F208_9ZZZZ